MSEVMGDNLVYIIYILGFIGNLKGVMIEYRNIVIMIYWVYCMYFWKELVGVLVLILLFFDLFVFELFVFLMMGGKVIVIENVLYLEKLFIKGVILVNIVLLVVKELVWVKIIFFLVKVMNLVGELLLYLFV